MPSAGPRLREVLRSGTRDVHERSEAAFVLGAADVSRAEYGAVLARLLTFYGAAEAALAPWVGEFAALGIDLAAREKAPFLRRDLRALRLDGDAAHRADALPTLAHALGAAYVLEGATLGGQLLRRRLGPALGLTPAAGLAFFSAYGDDVGAMWRAFGTALDRFDAALDASSGDAGRAEAHARALVGAREGFLAFERVVVTPTARTAAVPRR